MIGETLLTDKFFREINSEEPNIDKIKYLIINSFNEENGTNFDLGKTITYEQEKEIVGWLNCKNQDLIVQKEVFSQDLTDTSSTMVKSK